MKVDETGAGNIHLRDLFVIAERCKDLGCYLSWVFASWFGQAHRDIACEVAMTGVPCMLDSRRNIEIRRRIGEIRYLSESVSYKVCDDVLHGAFWSGQASRQFYRVIGGCIGPVNWIG